MPEWLSSKKTQIANVIKDMEKSAVVQSLSRVQLFVTPMDYSMPVFLVLHSLLELAQTHVHWVSDAIQTSHPLSSPSPALIFASIWVFSNESALRIRWLKSWSFSFKISRSNIYPGLISFRVGWLDLLAVQGILKSFLQHHSSKASILWHPAFLWSNTHIHTWLLGKS